MSPYEREMLAIALYGQWRATSILTENPEPSWTNTSLRTREVWREAAEYGAKEFSDDPA